MITREEFDKRVAGIMQLRYQRGPNIETAQWQHEFGELMVEMIFEDVETNGLLRRILGEVPSEYPSLDYPVGHLNQQQAYIMHGEEGADARVLTSERTVAPGRYFRIGSFPQVRKEDWLLDPESRWELAVGMGPAFRKSEDARLLVLIEAAHKAKELELRRFHDLLHRWKLHPERVLIVNDEEDDLPQRPTLHGGVGGATMFRNPAVKPGMAYLVPTGLELGATAQGYWYHAEPNSTTEKFMYGWVVDEYLSMAVLKPDGIEIFSREFVPKQLQEA